MQTPTMRDRALATAAGMVFLAGTCGVVFEDLILKGAAFALKHYIALAIMAGTIFAGHLAHKAWKGRSFLASVGFAVVFVAGTALIVYLSTGRQAADQMRSEAQVEQDAGRRADILKDRAKAKAMLDQAQADLARECKSGKGKRCDGIKATVDVYTAAVAGHDADLAKIGPNKVAAPEAEQLAKVLAVFGFNEGKTKAAALLIVPFLVTLFFELGTVVSLGYAFRHAPTAAVKIEAERTWQTDYPADADLSNVVALFGPLPDDRPGPSGGSSGPDRPAPKGPKIGPESTPDGRKDRVIASILTSLASGRTFPRQADLCERFGVPRSTMSDWLSEWEAAGLIPHRTRVGRCKALAG